MRIRELNIKHFKGFNSLEITPNGKSVVLFGVNGVGKSTILSAINYIFRPFLAQLNPMQSRSFGSFEDDYITVGEDALQIFAIISMDGYNYPIMRYYKKSQANDRTTPQTYARGSYSSFKEAFREKYLKSDDVGMPIFVHYGTNRTVTGISLARSKDTQYDKLSAIERAVETDSNFRSFFEWYLKLETSHLLNQKDKKEKQDSIALQNVNHVIEYMLGDVNHLEVKNNPLRMVVKKGNKEIRVDLLSDGEKCTLALLGDLTRRLCLANPNAIKPLEGSGIVLIDEIELHMHPSWQRKILPALRHLFPNIQFLVTTHSPQVLGEATDEYQIISIFIDGEENIAIRTIQRMNGYDSNLILEDYMETAPVSKLKHDLVEEINTAIREAKFSEAISKMEQLRTLSGDSDYDYLLLEDYLRRSRSR